VRAFLAVPADEAWVESARRLVGRLAPALPPAAWTRPESWHITLKFLGEIPAEDAERFADSIRERFAVAPGGELSGGGAVVLPPLGRPRVLGAGFAVSSSALAPLADLARTAETLGRGLGAPSEERPFRPHVTLGRIRAPWPASAIDAFRTEADAWAFPEWRVRSCVLYESRLRPSGAIHTPLHEWTLAPAVPAARA
jgi:RNA 2',3'-cyclic 3'-phosphodiesterase